LTPDRYAEPVIIARQGRIAGGMHPLDVGSAVYL
jgi:hypothetical protein